MQTALMMMLVVIWQVLMVIYAVALLVVQDGSALRRLFVTCDFLLVAFSWFFRGRRHRACTKHLTRQPQLNLAYAHTAVTPRVNSGSEVEVGVSSWGLAPWVIQPGWDTTSWFKYSDADLTKVEAKRRGPAIASPFIGPS